MYEHIRLGHERASEVMRWVRPVIYHDNERDCSDKTIKGTDSIFIRELARLRPLALVDCRAAITRYVVRAKGRDVVVV